MGKDKGKLGDSLTKLNNFLGGEAASYKIAKRFYDLKIIWLTVFVREIHRNEYWHKARGV